MNMIDNAIGKIIGSGKKIGGKSDWDFDGVVNSKDCQPRNTMRQDNMSTASRTIMDRFRNMRGGQTSGKLPPYRVQGNQIRATLTPQTYTKPVKISGPVSYPNTLPVHPDLIQTTRPLYQRPDGRIEIYNGQPLDKSQNPYYDYSSLIQPSEGKTAKDFARQYYKGQINKKQHQQRAYRIEPSRQPTYNVTHSGAAARGYKGRIRR